MRFVRLLPLVAVLALAGAAHAASAKTTAPLGLHGFVLRADEPRTTVFHATPSFAWKPVAGALRYEFQLSLSTTFHDNSVLYANDTLTTPVAAPGLTLPWITGNPHSLYARVRAITSTGATPWSAAYGFDVLPPPPPAPLGGAPGLLRWTAAPGAQAYPISSFTWILVYKTIPNADRGKQLLDFVHWALHDGEGSAASLDYAPLPAVLVTRLDSTLATIKLGATP